MDDNDRELDQIDRKILSLLSADGRMSVTTLSSKVGLSKTPCQVRVKRLQDDGFITGFRAVLNMNKLGREHVAFTEVKLMNTSEAALAAFNKAVRQITEVEQCHLIAGSFDYLLKVRTTSIGDYRRVLGEKISALPHVASTSTYVSMQAIIENTI